MLYWILIVVLVWGTLLVALRATPVADPMLVSHRGAAALAPENTLAGLAEGATLGATIVEVDVRRARDGTLVLMHDGTVDRTTDGTGAVGDLSGEELESLNAGVHFGPRFQNEGVPTLESALHLAADERVHLMVEIKDPKLYPGIHRQVAGLLTSTDSVHSTTVISFDHQWLEEFHRLAPEVQLGALSLWVSWQSTESICGLVSVFWPSVLADPSLVRRVHSRGQRIIVWTVNNAPAMELLVWLGVDGIVTDRPDLGARVHLIR